MSFFDTATEALDRVEDSLNALLSDAQKAKAYREVAQIAALADAVAGFRRGENRMTSTPPFEPETASFEPADGAEPTWMRPSASEPTQAVEPSWLRSSAEAAKGAEPSWMRPKSR